MQSFRRRGGRRPGVRPAPLIKRLFGRDRLIGQALLASMLVVLAADPRPVELLRLRLFDFYQWAQPRTVSVRPVTIVDIDEASLLELGQWPWPRRLLARLVDALRDMGAVLVAFDVVFPESDRLNPADLADGLDGLDAPTLAHLRQLPSNDEVFAEAIARGRVVLGRVGYGGARDAPIDVPLKKSVVVKRAKGAPPPEAFVVRAPTLIRNIPVIEASGTGHGLVSLLPEPDGIVRRVPAVVEHGGDLFPTLSMEMLRVALGRPSLLLEIDEAGVSALHIAKGLSVPTDLNGRIWPYFSRRDEDKYVSARDVLSGRADGERIKDRLVIIGTSAFGLHDIRATPVDRALPGVEVHAQIIENVVTGQLLKRPGYLLAAELALLFCGGALLIWLVPKVGAAWTMMLVLAVAGSAAATSWYLFDREKVLFDVGFTVVALVLLYTVLTYFGYASEQASRRRVRTAFAHYLSPAMVERLAEDPGQLKLGGETRPMSILFCDVRGFTGISESFKNDPGGLTRLINTLLTPLTAIILERQGTVDKYMGDCIMAFWNAPIDDPHHARHACLAAIEMQAAMRPLNARLAAEAAEEGRRHVALAIGIGINSGEVVVGNMGSDQRFDYSVIGDDVNLASRLEGQSKGYGVGIVIGEKTWEQAPELALLELDMIRVKGKMDAARIFTLVGDEGIKGGNTFAVLEHAHNGMLASYRAQRWVEARERLAACRELMGGFDLSGLYALYERRIAEYEASPPGAGWDGVYVAATK